MGYNTEFRGELKFKKELTASQLAKISSFLGEDGRDHPEWCANLSYINLELNADFSGIQWNDTEKTYDMVGCVNLIIREMVKICPDFELEGKFLAQGEDIDDRWNLIIENGMAVRKELSVKGKKIERKKIECPHCGEVFIYDER